MARNTPRSLHAGAEAVIGKGQVAERLMGKFGKVWAQPPPLPAPEALPPAGRSTNCHAPGGHRAVLPAPFGVELLSEQRSTAEKMAGRLRNVEGARPWRAKEEMEVAEAPPSDAALRAMRYFISRARGAGAHRMASLLAQLQAAVRPGQQALSQEDFSRVALAQGLCRCLYDSELVFQQLGGSEASVEQLAEILRGGLDPSRAALVKEAWDVLDPDERGVIQVRHLLRCFDARRLPDVRLGREDAEVALLKFLDGLGVSNRFDRAEDFAMEETAARRRPQLVTVHREPAGRPCVRQKVAATPAPQDMQPLVSLDAWKAYFTALSTSIPDEEIFRETLREPLLAYQAYGRLQADRLIMEPMGRNQRCKLQVLGIFRDGSRKLLTLRDDSGLEKLSGSAGCGDGQLWAWGEQVQQEIVRRLQADGYPELRAVRLKPS